MPEPDLAVPEPDLAAARALFDAIVDLPNAARTPRLQELCADATLRDYVLRLVAVSDAQTASGAGVARQIGAIYQAAAGPEVAVGDQLGACDGGGIDRDFVCPGQQQRARVVDGAYPAADGQRHEAHLRGAAHHLEQRPAPLVARRDVEEAQLVGSRGVVGARLLDRVAGVLEVDEVDPLDHAAVGDVEARDDADADGHVRGPGPSRRVLCLPGCGSSS